MTRCFSLDGFDYVSEGGFPTVSSSTGDWVVDPTTHSLLWTAPRVSSTDDTKTGTLEFSVGGDDAAAFFPVKVDFTAVGDLIGITVSCCLLLCSNNSL